MTLLPIHTFVLLRFIFQSLNSNNYDSFEPFMTSNIIFQLYLFAIMKKSTKKNQKANSFFIKGNHKTFYHQTVHVLFEAQQDRGFVRPQMRQFANASNIPTFNSDGKIYTPGFIVPSHQQEDQKHLDYYHKKVDDLISIRQQQIMVARPKNKDFCSVCKLSFDDYMEHIQSDSHDYCLRIHPFHKKIRKLCKSFTRLTTRSSSQQSNYEESCLSQLSKQSVTGKILVALI